MTFTEKEIIILHYALKMAVKRDAFADFFEGADARLLRKLEDMIK